MELFLYKPAFISWDLQWKISWHGSFSSVKTSKNSEYQNLARGRTFCASAGYILRLYCILWAISHTHYIPCVVFCWESVFRAIPEKEWKNSQDRTKDSLERKHSAKFLKKKIFSQLCKPLELRIAFRAKILLCNNIQTWLSLLSSNFRFRRQLWKFTLQSLKQGSAA